MNPQKEIYGLLSNYEIDSESYFAFDSSLSGFCEPECSMAFGDSDCNPSNILMSQTNANRHFSTGQLPDAAASCSFPLQNLGSEAAEFQTLENNLNPPLVTMPNDADQFYANMIQLPANAESCGSKTRIRWSQDLHRKFIDCVNRLGGAEKATPKAILKMMNTEGLSILHVKSHLQKYRVTRHIPESAKAKTGKRTSDADFTTTLDPKLGNELMDALREQVDVQRRLKEQLEIQRDLQLRIEEEGKRLKQMLDNQLKKHKSLSIPEDSALVSENSSSEDC